MGVGLNASGSGSEYNITAYEWDLNYRGRDFKYYSESFNFSFEKPGNYTAHLKITDEMCNVAYDNVSVTIMRLPYFYETYWVWLFVVTPLVIIAVLAVVFKYRRDHALYTPTDREKTRLQIKELKLTWKIFKANRLGFAGLIVLVIFLLMAIFAPILSTVPNPNDPNTYEGSEPDFDWKNPLPPKFDPSPFTGLLHPFGTDQKGQDVYSSTLYGARGPSTSSARSVTSATGAGASNAPRASRMRWAAPRSSRARS